MSYTEKPLPGRRFASGCSNYSACRLTPLPDAVMGSIAGMVPALPSPFLHG
jgi:hypothetical protein